MNPKKYIKMPFFIKKQICRAASEHAKAAFLDDTLIKYFKENNIYDEVRQDYIQFVVNSNSPELFIEKFIKKYK